ncbi:MAG: DUF4349 domain-containing protein [Luteimonas sp.]
MDEVRYPRVWSTCLLILLLLGCAPSPDGGAEMDAATAVDVPQPASASAAGSAAPDAQVEGATQLVSAAMTQVDPGRRFVQTAGVRFAVEDVYRSALAIEDLAARQGGFVVSNRIRSETRQVRRHAIGGGRQLELAEYTTRGELVVRVPGDRTQAFLRELAAQITFLDSRDFEARDVQFELLRQQLAHLRSETLQQSLAQAVQADDRLDRKGDAFAARAQALAARDEAQVAQRELEDRIAFATLSLTLEQPPQVRRSERIDPDAAFAQHRPGFFPRLGHALQGGWQGLLDLTVVLATLWPLWLCVIAGVAAARAWIRLRARRRG